MVVYCKAIFPQLVCWKTIYHLRITHVVGTVVLFIFGHLSVSCRLLANVTPVKGITSVCSLIISTINVAFALHVYIRQATTIKKKDVCMRVHKRYLAICRVTKYTSSGKAISMARPRFGKCTEYKYLPNIAVVGTVRQLIT